MGRHFFVLAVVLGGLAAALSPARVATACPFCSAVSQTFSEEINTMDVAVIGRLIDMPAVASAGSPAAGADLEKAKFEILKVIKGQDLMKGQRQLETLYFGEGRKGAEFLIMGVDPPNLMWSTPLPLSERAREYVVQLPSLPEQGADRLAFFQEHLEDQDEMLARDAYDEFAKAPYASVIDLKDRMKHDQLVAWIKDPNIPAPRRRLYLTMLGVCGQPSDLPMLEEMLKSDDRAAKAGLDAMIACYLTLKGAEGLPLIEELFLKSDKAEYADTYAAIMALRFHGTESDVIPKDRIVKSLHHMLDRPQLADLVIPDLARWEDWSQMERLVTLFKEADDKSSWVRVPVVNYLRACPLPEAEKYLAELEQIDPEAVKRANTFFPFGPGAAQPAGEPTEDKVETGVEPAAGVESASPTPEGPVSRSNLPATSGIVAEAQRGRPVATVASPRDSADPVASPPNRWILASVPWAGGALLMVVLWTILGGSRG